MMSSSMLKPYLSKIILFAGGKGSRLAELTTTVPKPAVDVNNRPLITYLCDWAFSHHFDTILIAAGYKQDILKRKLMDYYQLSKDICLTARGVEQQLSGIPQHGSIMVRDTGPDADTAERLFAMRDLVADDEYFMVTYGDTLTNLDPKPLIEVAKRTNKLITMCIGYPDARYGEILTEGDIITTFEEKKRPQFFVNRGFFIVKSELFNLWQSHFFSFEYDVLPYFVKQQEVAAHRETCWFHSVDSIKDLQELEKQLISKISNTKITEALTR